ncbi:hypothetical protein M3Y96_00837800 [Aphelenchoides besseyi]|nr:hypothetical protein M3Y96_00837800 [Aphelenchoides besseyi]
MNEVFKKLEIELPTDVAVEKRKKRRNSLESPTPGQSPQTLSPAVIFIPNDRTETATKHVDTEDSKTEKEIEEESKIEKQKKRWIDNYSSGQWRMMWSWIVFLLIVGFALTGYYLILLFRYY